MYELHFTVPFTGAILNNIQKIWSPDLWRGDFKLEVLMTIVKFKLTIEINGRIF